MFVALKTEHDRQLNEITERFESIKHSLSVSDNRHLLIVFTGDLFVILSILFFVVDILSFRQIRERRIYIVQ